MDAVTVSHSSGVRQALVLKNQVRVVPSAVTFAPFTSFVLDIPVSPKNK